jgi:hypothetical protein
MDLHTWALYDELVCLPLIGGNNLESIMFISPVADLWDYVSPPQGAGLIVLSIGDGILTLICPLGSQTQYHLTLLQFSLFMSMSNSWTHLFGENVSYSYNRLLFWACMLNGTCLCVSFETPFGETMWSQEMLPPWWSFMYSAILNRRLIGDAILPFCRKIITNLWLKFSGLIWFLYMLFLLHWPVKDWAKNRVIMLNICYKLLSNLAD